MSYNAQIRSCFLSQCVSWTHGLYVKSLQVLIRYVTDATFDKCREDEKSFKTQSFYRLEIITKTADPNELSGDQRLGRDPCVIGTTGFMHSITQTPNGTPYEMDNSTPIEPQYDDGSKLR